MAGSSGEPNARSIGLQLPNASSTNPRAWSDRLPAPIAQASAPITIAIRNMRSNQRSIFVLIGKIIYQI